jgi:hypothetical protein
MMTEDAQLEVEIDYAYRAMLGADKPEIQRAAFDVMRNLIAHRSPAQIERMERERGLRVP